MSSVIHIGFPKTGTTSLQQGYFPNFPGGVYLARGNSPRFRELVGNVQQADDVDFAPDRARALLAEARGDARTLIMSWEGFCVPSPEYAERTPGRLHEIAPDAKIIVCVRSQRTSLPSHYNQHVKNGCYQPFSEWLATVKDRYVLYDLVVERYQRRFGADRVLVAPFERFVGDRERFLGDLAQFIDPGAPSLPPATPLRRENQSLSVPTRWVMRHTNRLFMESWFNRNPPLNLGRAGAYPGKVLRKLDPIVFRRLPRALSTADQELAARFSARYAQSNTRLAALTGLPLAELGYPVAAPAVTS